MKYLKIVNGFTEMTDAYLLVRAKFIMAGITGNAHFQTPSPSLADMNATINSFELAVEKAEGGNRQDIAEKNQIKQTLIAQLHLLGNYVLFTSAGSEVVATSSGFSHW